MHALQILGRSNMIADYVKKGENEGFTEIYLSKDTNGSRIVVKRVMKKEGTSTWKLNGAAVDERLSLSSLSRMSVSTLSSCQGNRLRILIKVQCLKTLTSEVGLRLSTLMSRSVNRLRNEDLDTFEIREEGGHHSRISVQSEA